MRGKNILGLVITNMNLAYSALINATLLTSSFLSVYVGLQRCPSSVQDVVHQHQFQRENPVYLYSCLVVLSVLQSLSYQAPGPDRILKEYAVVLSDPICHVLLLLINISLLRQFEPHQISRQCILLSPGFINGLKLRALQELRLELSYLTPKSFDLIYHKILSQKIFSRNVNCTLDG